MVETAGDVVSGSGQLLAVTLELGGSVVGDVVQFVIDHTGFIGEALGALLDKAGILLGKALGWLLDKVGWVTSSTPMTLFSTCSTTNWSSMRRFRRR